jgi:hypothetical protein
MSLNIDNNILLIILPFALCCHLSNKLLATNPNTKTNPTPRTNTIAGASYSTRIDNHDVEKDQDRDQIEMSNSTPQSSQKQQIGGDNCSFERVQQPQYHHHHH